MLEEGVDMIIDGSEKQAMGFLFTFVPDILGSHEIGGFILSTPCILSTRQDYDAHCSLLEKASHRDQLSRLYGINFHSILNGLQFYHVVKGLPPSKPA